MDPRLAKALTAGTKTYNTAASAQERAKKQADLREQELQRRYRELALSWIDDHLFALIEGAMSEGTYYILLNPPHSVEIPGWVGPWEHLSAAISELDGLTCVREPEMYKGDGKQWCARFTVYWDKLPV